MGKKKKKIKINKTKLIKRIVSLLIVIVAVILFIKYIPSGNGTNTDKLALIVDNTDITETLVSDIYIDKDKVLYLSMTDIKNIFDKNLYYEENSGKLITTSGTKVAAIDVNNNTIEINSATLLLSCGIIKYDTDYYIPLSEITNVYNIEITITENAGIVSSLYKELITVTASKKLSLKKSTSTFSNTIQKISQGEELIYIEEAEKTGWIKVLTYEGNIGYVKENKVSEKEYKRENMEEIYSNDVIETTDGALEVNKTMITEEALKNFSSRKELIEEIISNAINSEIYVAHLNLYEVEVEEKLLERFVLELMPRLKEIGGNIIITNNSILSADFLSNNNINNI